MWKARLSELDFDETELAGVLDAIDSEWITAGPRTAAFEKAFASLCGTTDAIAVCNGTAALFLALKALGIGPGETFHDLQVLGSRSHNGSVRCGTENHCTNEGHPSCSLCRHSRKHAGA